MADRIKKRLVNSLRAPAVREQIIERAGRCCEYCRSPLDYSSASFALEHIVPRSAGGGNSPDNLALSCPGCNAHKYTKTMAADPISGERVVLFHPRTMEWSDHFAWNADFTEIIGVTPTGRATVAALRLNRPGVVNLRKALL